MDDIEIMDFAINDSPARHSTMQSTESKMSDPVDLLSKKHRSYSSFTVAKSIKVRCHSKSHPSLELHDVRDSPINGHPPFGTPDAAPVERTPTEESDESALYGQKALFGL